MMSASSLVVFIGGLVGAQLAPKESLSTLPVASIIIGTAVFTVPVAMMMKSLGRKSTFLTFTIFGIFTAFLAAFSIINGMFILFCISTALLGATISSANHFRFAAMESVSKEQIPKAASTVLLGGIAAAFLGPEIGTLGKNLFGSEFSGSFVLLAGLFVLGFITLLIFENTVSNDSEYQETGRSIFKIAKQPAFLAAVTAAMFGYAIMSFIMTATPVSMHIMDGYDLNITKWVIQTHIVAMFLPSLIVPWIISKIGTTKLMYGGLIAFCFCIVIALAGHEVWNYWVALILLGIGWNFLFVGGTTLLPLSYKDNERFKVQAINDLMIFSAQATAALSAGYVVHHLSWESVLLLNIPVMLIPLSGIMYYHVSTKV